jgi:hypothetical protein
MSTSFQIPEWLVDQSAPPPLPPVDDHRVEGLVNGFIAGKQDALFDAPDAFYRSQGRDAVDGAPAIAQRLQDLRSATLDQARDDGERAALGPRLDAHVDDAMDGIGRHLDAQQQVLQRQIIATRQGLIQRAATLEHDNDDKIAGLAAAHARAARNGAYGWPPSHYRFRYGSLLDLCDAAEYRRFVSPVREIDDARPARHLPPDEPDRTKGCWRENPDQPLVREDQEYVLYLTFAGLAVHVADDYCPDARRPDNPIIVPYRRLESFMLPGPWRDELLKLP